MLREITLKFNVEDDKYITRIYKEIRKNKMIMKLTKNFMDKFDSTVKKDISINDTYKLYLENNEFIINVTGWLKRIEIIVNDERMIIENINKKDSSKLFKPVFILLNKLQNN